MNQEELNDTILEYLNELYDNNDDSVNRETVIKALDYCKQVISEEEGA